MVSVRKALASLLAAPKQAWARWRSRYPSVKVLQAEIAARRRVEEALRKSEARFTLFMRNSPAISFIKSVSGNYVWANREMLQRFPDCIGKHDYELFPDDLAKPLRDHDREVLRTGEAKRYVEVVRDKAGIESHWLILKFPMPDTVSDRLLLGSTAVDITEQREVEAELQRTHQDLMVRNAQLQASNAELEAFSYSASHDLRAPLTVIGSFAEILAEKYNGCLDAQGQAHLQRIRNAAQRMSALIESLLQLSKVTRAQFKPQTVHISTVAKIVLDELQASAPSRKIDLRVTPGLETLGDPSMIRSALENLLGNAWKFTSKTESAIIEFGAVESSGVLTFYVRDNGDGFDMDQASSLFTPFKRLHTVQEFEGTGIGLATVQRIIQRHNGNIWAVSAPGQGATFYFTLGSSQGLGAVA